MEEFNRPSPYSATRLIRHLWWWRYVLLATPVVAIILGVIFVRTQMSDTFESQAMLRIRTPPSAMRAGPSLDHLDPPVYEEIFLSPGLLFDVVQAARQEFPDFPRSGFEDIKKRFQVNIITTRETVVSSEFSPIAQLSVTGNSPERAHFLMQTWLDLSLQRFGRLRADEATEIRQQFRTEYEKLRSSASSLHGEEARLQQELQNVSQLLNARYQQLKGESAARRLSVQAIEDEESQPESGLYREQTRLQLALAEAKGADNSQAGANSLQRRLDKVNELITETLDEIDSLSERRVSVSRELEATREELLLAREQTEQVREILATTTPDAIVMEDPLNPELSNEYSVLSWPVMPEKRIGPPKAAIAVGIAAAITFFVILLILLQFYVATALREGEKHQPAS